MTVFNRSLSFALSAGTLALALSLAPTTSHAFWGLLGKLGSAAGKAGAGAAGKGAAAGGAAVAGAEVAQGANAAGKAAKLGAASEGAAAAEGGAKAATSADELSKASGLGKAVPDDIAAMMTTKGKTLLDVPDPGTRAWLGSPATKLGPADADLMVRDYVKLLEGKPAGGPAKAGDKVADKAASASTAPKLPGNTPVNTIPWHAVELLARAAHIGHRGAQSELDRLCRANPNNPVPTYCAKPLPTVAQQSKKP
jgi:hypothetical protein